MKTILALTILATCLLSACYQAPLSTPITGTDRKPIEQPIDTAEKHFDCTIAEVIGTRAMPPYAYITECGIMFYADDRYQVGQAVKGFTSTKHK
jgi:hypothetical protein